MDTLDKSIKDMTKIVKEAYYNGHKDGYDKGINAAWKCIQALDVLTPQDCDELGFNMASAIHGMKPGKVISEMVAFRATDKKSDSLQLYDVVHVKGTDDDAPFVITFISENGIPHGVNKYGITRTLWSAKSGDYEIVEHLGSSEKAAYFLGWI